MPNALTPEIFRFGPFELDAELEELRRAALVLRLPHQPFQLLLMLVRRAGEMVTRQEIREALWGSDTYVDFEHGINSVIRQIRFHLGDSAEAPRYVRTLPRRGYVFVAAVEHVVPATPEPEAPPVISRRAPHRLRWLIGGAVGMLIVAITMAATMWHPQVRESVTRGQRAIGVVPFRVIGALPPGINARSFTEELRASVGRLPQRHVALLDEASTRRADVRIEGTIQHEGDNVRVIVRGIDAASGTQTWSETCDRPIAKQHGMALQTAHAVACEVARRFLPPPRHEPLLKTRVSPKAAELYRLGRLERMRSYPDQTSNRVQQFFENALREEPKFAEAWSALADLWAERAVGGPARLRAEAVRQSRECARRALALQPDNVEARSAMGILALQYDYDLVAAEQIFRRVIAKDPEYCDGHHNLALTLTARGEFDAAMLELRTARELDPVFYDLHPAEGTLNLRARRFEDALAWYREILAVRPDSRAARWGTLSAYIAQRRWKEAIETAREIGDLPPHNPSASATLEGFRSVYRLIEPVCLRNYEHEIFDDYAVAAYYAQLGDADRSIESLRRAIDAHSPAVCFLLVDPRIDNLRNDSRFGALVQRTRLRK